MFHPSSSDIQTSWQGDSSFQRNICFLNRSIMEKIFIDFDGIKSRIDQKSIRVNQRMHFRELLSYGNQCFGIGKVFILIRRVGFFRAVMFGYASRRIHHFCGFWRFANAYLNHYKKEEKYEFKLIKTIIQNGNEIIF